jgi:transposase
LIAPAFPGPATTGQPRRTDLCSVVLQSLVHRADIQDSQGAVPLLRALHGGLPSLHEVIADRVYRGPKLLADLSDLGPWQVEIV